MTSTPLPPLDEIAEAVLKQLVRHDGQLHLADGAADALTGWLTSCPLDELFGVVVELVGLAVFLREGKAPAADQLFALLDEQAAPRLLQAGPKGAEAAALLQEGNTDKLAQFAAESRDVRPVGSGDGPTLGVMGRFGLKVPGE